MRRKPWHAVDTLNAFMPDEMGFRWWPDRLNVHVVSDAFVALSCLCIAVLFVVLVRGRPALRRFGGFFSAFILSCAFTHGMEILTLWRPDDWLVGSLQVVTAIGSFATALALVSLMPLARAPHGVTELDRGHAELESQYKLIVENGNDGVWLIDATARTTFVNARMIELLGSPVGQIIGAPITAFMDEATDAAVRNRFTQHVDYRQAAFRDLSLRRKDGLRLWADMQVKPILRADGGTIGTLCVVVDALERRRTLTAIAATDRNDRLLAEAMPIVVFTTDCDGGADYSNRAWYDYTGLSEAQTRGTGWSSVIHPDDRPRVEAAWSRATTKREPFEIEMRMRRASDGAYRWFLTRITPVVDPSGTMRQWIGTAADIHDYKLATETRTVLDTMGHIVSICNADSRFEYVSPNWSRYTGMNTAAAASSDWHDYIHPDDLETVDRHDRASRESTVGVQQDEIRLRAVDGSYRWFLSRTVALAQTDETTHRRVNTLTDIDDLKRAQSAIGSSEARYTALTDAIPQILLIIDEHSQIEYANTRWANYAGAEFANAPHIFPVVHPDDRAVLEAASSTIATRDNDECELRIRRHDGVYRWHLLSRVSLETVAPDAKKWIITGTDIEARKSAEAELADSAATLAHQADHDPLTNLPNREKLGVRLGEMIAEAQRDGTIVVVMYLDIDHFKTVNDTLGHNAGDQILIETGARIRASLRIEDTASRFGGDEFVVACRADDIVDAARIAERLQSAVRMPIELEGKRFIVASSIGISLFPHDGDVAVDLIQKADAAMYATKQSGRNAWGFFSAQTHVPAVAALEMEVDLREAIAREQFVVYYQPIIDVVSGRVIGAEALVRWAHPERGLLPPSDFIAFAEDHGLIAPIGELVLHATCAQLRRMQLRGSDDFSIAVNVSARQFAKPGFIGTIASAIAEHEIDPRRLEIEITESVVMGDTESVLATLDKLEALGVRLSLDDFGTGYSSLAYIKNFPIHTLKIDRSFVTDIASNFTDQAIAKTIVTLAHSLGMRTIAEGVETVEQLDRLRAFGADCFQGYLVSRPIPADEFEAFLADRRSVRTAVG